MANKKMTRMIIKSLKLKQKQKPGYNMINVTILIVVLIQIAAASAMFIPNSSRYQPIMQRRMDDIDTDGEDDMDQTASAPYQNQDDSNNGDSYDDNEPDGPYGETPREEEGQADLERFFDDHLGASEKDGMDKENLPTNLIPVIIPLKYAQTNTKDHFLVLGSETNSRVNSNTEINQPASGYSREGNLMPNIETKFIQLPNNKLIITRKITRGPVYKGGIDLPTGIPPIPNHVLTYDDDNADSNNREYDSNNQDDKLNANGSEIVATEDDDFDRVYVTKLNDKPFKIEALGGYDPEEDFRDASRDIEESNRFESKRRKGKVEQDALQNDISFNDPEPDVLFNDASETDEVTFAQDDPYQTDLEAEMRAQAYDVPGRVASLVNPSANKPLDSEASEPKVSKGQEEDSEGGWINDGVEDMEIPSQADQDVVLAKAAKQEELARRAAEDEAAADNQQAENETEREEPENQRMANADYLKDDLNSMDDQDDGE